MPEANQITFTNRELLELLIKKADVHEGRWMLLTNFGFSAGNFGPSPDQISPGAIIVINYMGIQKAGPETAIESALDAAVVNPAPTSTSKRRPSEQSPPAAS